MFNGSISISSVIYFIISKSKSGFYSIFLSKSAGSNLFSSMSDLIFYSTYAVLLSPLLLDETIAFILSFFAYL